MNEELNLLQLVCHKLNTSNISYMLTGSLAANFYAIPRMTRDIDIVVELFEPDITRFFQTFQNEFYIEKGAILQAIRHQNMFNIIHNDTIFKIDFVIRKGSPFRMNEFHRRRQMMLGNTPIWIVSPEDLIISKLIWAKDTHSDFQLRDIRNLLSTTENLNEEYIAQWVKEQELDTIYEKAKSNG